MHSTNKQLKTAPTPPVLPESNQDSAFYTEDQAIVIEFFNQGRPIQFKSRAVDEDWRDYNGWREDGPHIDYNEPELDPNYLWRTNPQFVVSEDVAKTVDDDRVTTMEDIDREMMSGESKQDQVLNAGQVQIGGNHYKSLAIQPAEFISKNNIGFLEGCVIKRMCRHGNKNKIEDLQKAIHEIQLIAQYTYGIDILTEQ